MVMSALFRPFQIGSFLSTLAPSAVGLALIAATSAAGADIYWTEFEEFDVGPDKWVGTNGWVGNSTNCGVHGIDNGMVPALDNTAFIGGGQPSSRLVIVARPVNIDPAADGTPLIEFETLVGIEDSTNGKRDSFFFTFYSISGGRLASIRFSNENASFGLWRLDGASQFDTGADFIRGGLHLLFASVDLSRNRWSADLDGIPLFKDETFNATGQTLTFGSAAAEWQLAATDTTGYGDNWMLVADWSIRAIPEGTTPLVVGPVATPTLTNSAMVWAGDPGFDYRVEYSSNLVHWIHDLPGSTFSNITSTGSIFFADATASNVTRRFYRVNRTATP